MYIYIYIAHQHDAQGHGAEEDDVLEVRSELDVGLGFGVVTDLRGELRAACG